jgi:hypothetical protein
VGGEPAVVGGEVVVADVEVSALGLCFLAFECAALDLTVVVVVERILGLVVVVVTRGFGLVVVVVEWDLVVEAFFFDGPLVVGGDLVVGADLVVGGDLVVVGADLVVEGFFLDGPLVVGGDLVVGGAFVVEGDLAAGRGVERPLFLNGALVVDVVGMGLDVVGRGLVVEVVVEVTRALVLDGRRLALVVGGDFVGGGENELLARVVGGERRRWARPLCEGGLVVEGALALVVGGAVDAVDNGNEVKGTAASSVVGGAALVVAVVELDVAPAPGCDLLGTPSFWPEGALPPERTLWPEASFLPEWTFWPEATFLAEASFLPEWTFLPEARFLRELTFLALCTAFGGWTVVAVKDG